MNVSLIIQEGKQKGREIPLPETIFLIGRDPQCHLRPHCNAVSQLHCVIAAWAGKVRIRDLQSRNGTIVNGLKIRDEIEVEDGDEVQVGTLVFRIKCSKSGKTMASDDAEEAKWLLFSSADSPVLSPGVGTSLLSARDFSDYRGGMTGSTAKRARTNRLGGSESTTVSAGFPLISYIEKKQKQNKNTPRRT